jgi:hypothetical protein
MFRKLFRIGFGGCGCALENTFINQVRSAIRSSLWDYSRGLAELEKFSKEEKRRLNIENVKKMEGYLKEGTVYTFDLQKLDYLEGMLEEWETSVRKSRDTGRWWSYEGNAVEKIVDDIRETKEEVRDVKNRIGVLLEGLMADSATPSELHQVRDVYLYNQDIIETRELIVDKYGKNLIDSDGFKHHPEQQMLALSIKKVRDEVFEKIEREIEQRRIEARRGYFFFVGLGGGTGTGVISPIAQKIGEGLRGYFVLGVLSGKEDNKYLNPQQPWFRRCFNVVLALNDLMTIAVLDGILLMDNKIIIDRIKGKLTQNPKDSEGLRKNAEAMDEEIIKAMLPAFGETACENSAIADWSRIKEVVRGERKSPIFVPCYASGNKSTAELIEDALTEGKLANCGDYTKADKIMIFTRSLESKSSVKQKLETLFGERKIEFIEKNREDVIHALRDNDIILLESDEIGQETEKKEVLVLLRNPDIKDALHERLEVAESFVCLLNTIVELIENERQLLFTINDVKNLIEDLNVERVTEGLPEMFENNHYPLKNPKIDILQKGSKWLIRADMESYLVQKEAERLNVYSGKSEEIARKIIDSVPSQIKEALDRIPKEDIAVKDERAKIQKILKEAQIFLFPEDITESKKDVNYHYMAGIVKNFKEEVDYALKELDNNNLPLFRKPIFSATRVYLEEKIVQQIRAMEERIGVLENRAPGVRITPSGRGLQGEPGKTGVSLEELEDLRARVESFGKPASSEDFNSLSNNFQSLKTEVESSEDFDSILKELKEQVESLSNRSEMLKAEKEQGILNRLKEILKPRRVEVSKPSLPEDKINSILKDVEELKELKEKVESLSSRSETLEAGEKLSTLYWLKQMTEINSISKDIEELKKLKDKVEPLGKPLPSEDIEELKDKVESLSGRSETLEAGEKLGILNWLKEMLKIKPRRVEVPKPSLSEDKINSILKDIEELKKKTESLPSEEKKKIGGRIIEEEMI